MAKCRSPQALAGECRLACGQRHLGDVLPIDVPCKRAVHHGQIGEVSAGWTIRIWTSHGCREFRLLTNPRTFERNFVRGRGEEEAAVDCREIGTCSWRKRGVTRLLIIVNKGAVSNVSKKVVRYPSNVSKGASHPNVWRSLHTSLKDRMGPLFTTESGVTRVFFSVRRNTSGDSPRYQQPADSTRSYR